MEYISWTLLNDRSHFVDVKVLAFWNMGFAGDWMTGRKSVKLYDGMEIFSHILKITFRYSVNFSKVN